MPAPIVMAERNEMTHTLGTRPAIARVGFDSSLRSDLSHRQKRAKTSLARCATDKPAALEFVVGMSEQREPKERREPVPRVQI
jgi:hypothetical protein